MGVDINGIEPLNEKGEWIGYNNLLWGAIWELCVNITPLLKRSDSDWSHLGSKSFAIKNNEHMQLIRRLGKVLKDRDNNYHYRNYIKYLEQMDEKDAALDALKDFMEFISNNQGFEVS